MHHESLSTVQHLFLPSLYALQVLAEVRWLSTVQYDWPVWNALYSTVVLEDVPLVAFMYLVFTCMPGESWCRRLGSLLCSCGIFWALFNSPISWFCIFFVFLRCRFFQNIVNKERRRPVRFRHSNSYDVDKMEYLCPLCEGLSNSVIPIIPYLPTLQREGWVCPFFNNCHPHHPIFTHSTTWGVSVSFL